MTDHDRRRPHPQLIPETSAGWTLEHDEDTTFRVYQAKGTSKAVPCPSADFGGNGVGSVVILWPNPYRYACTHCNSPANEHVRRETVQHLSSQQSPESDSRVENYKRLELSSVFEGRITNIKGSTLQFHIQKLILESDKYVECKFKRESDVLNLNIGSVVRVLGDLEDVNGVVQFKNCRIVR